ncbi:hypothetical protein HDU76_010936 [Blyttiomyces sp. JEL0837]|nr:hypothetical protein HDU76_010936 [Blyttiomyces sp. JEL0837]
MIIITLCIPTTAWITQAKNHPRFKKFCISVAQTYHTVEEQLKMRFFDYKVEKIRPLNDARAVELGASFMSEGIIFTVAGLTIVGEAWRTSKKASARVVNVDEALARIEAERLLDLESIGLLNERVRLIEDENSTLRTALQTCADTLKQQVASETKSTSFLRFGRADSASSERLQRLESTQDLLMQATLSANERAKIDLTPRGRQPTSVVANVVESGVEKLV